MKVVVVGGNLQGVETVYLAGKAGWDVRVIDRRPAAPAKGLCGDYVQLDVTAERNWGVHLKDVDLVIPALEDNAALASLARWTARDNVPFAFDPCAYAISSSKTASNRLFGASGITTPAAWPGCRFPVIAKPDGGSGSSGVRIFQDPDALERFLGESAQGPPPVLQAFVSGPMYSLEVIGADGDYRPLQVTDLHFDAVYDCKRVVAPSTLSAALVQAFHEMAVRVAAAMELKGLMDLEVVLNEGRLHLLEVDARIPSQTPTAVYWSSGLNLVRMTGELFLGNHPVPVAGPAAAGGVVYEHVQVAGDVLATAGEHIMSRVDPLHLCRDFFGADEALTNYSPGKTHWVATLIIAAADAGAAWEKRNRVLDELQRYCGVRKRIDPVPATIENRDGSAGA